MNDQCGASLTAGQRPGFTGTTQPFAVFGHRSLRAQTTAGEAAKGAFETKMTIDRALLCLTKSRAQLRIKEQHRRCSVSSLKKGPL